MVQIPDMTQNGFVTLLEKWLLQCEQTETIIVFHFNPEVKVRKPKVEFRLHRMKVTQTHYILGISKLIKHAFKR